MKAKYCLDQWLYFGKRHVIEMQSKVKSYSARMHGHTLPQCLFWCCTCMRCTCFSAAAWLRVITLEAVGAAAKAVRLLLPLGRTSIPTAAPGASAMASLGRLCTACWSATVCWLLMVLLLAELFALLVGSQGKGGLCCLSA